MKYNNRTGTSFNDEKARRKDCTKLDFRCPNCRSAIGQVSFFLFARTVSHSDVSFHSIPISDVPILLLNQPILKIWDETICLAPVVQIARRLPDKTWKRRLRGRFSCNSDPKMTTAKTTSKKRLHVRHTLSSLCRYCTTMTWKSVILRFMEEILNLEMVLLRIHFQKNSNELEKKWISELEYNRDEDWTKANSLLRDVFPVRRHCRWIFS